jgi:D-apiose dehydrogenase
VREPLIGIVGFGSIGGMHARVALSMGARVVVADPVVAADDLPHGVRLAASLEALLDERPSAIIVCTPDALHAPHAIAALERGIPVLVEKPMASSVEAARAMVAASEAHATALLVGYILRYGAILGAVSRVLSDGMIGAPVSFHADLGAYETLTRARNRFDGSSGGHLFADYSHEWDYLRWLLAPASRALGCARVVEGLPITERPNSVDGLLELENGIVGSFHLDYVRDPPERSLQIVGSHGSLAADLVSGVLGVRRRGVAGVEETRHGEAREAAFERQLRHLLAVAAGDARPAVTGADGIAALAVADAVRTSAVAREWTVIAPG